MTLRARLLDMGQVHPWRAYGLRLALAELLAAEDAPLVLLACAASAVVTVGDDRGSSGEIAAAAGEAVQVPVLRLPGGSPARRIDEGDLLLSLMVPRERAADLALPAANEDRHAWLASLVEAAGGPDLEAGAADVDVLAAGIELTAWLGCARAASPAAGRPAGSPAELGEALLRQLERRTDLELVPSMPRPEELDAVYEWERRLVAAAEREAASTVA